MKQFQFQVVSGTHTTCEGRDEATNRPLRKRYKRGDIIESNARLDKLYKNKFALVGAAPTAQVFGTAVVPPVAPTPTAPVRRSASVVPVPAAPNETVTPTATPVIWEAVHKGAGRWVIQTADGQPVTDPKVPQGFLPKQQAVDLVNSHNTAIVTGQPE